ncbi:MAG: calcium/sodium antiporter, partial [Euryarchaeota archaeon]|nr:calcium/sodium antiporter [Euryarchaeota archaeon]
AMIASLTGSTDIGVGVVIGSNIWNIAGILGISAIVSGIIKTESRGIKRDGMITLITALLLIFFMFFGDVTRISAIIMIIVYVFYLWILIRDQKKDSNEIKGNFKNPIDNESSSTKSFNIKTVLWTVVGFIGLVIGCRLLIYSGIEIAKIAGIPEMIMGLFTLAIATSIPELVVTLSSAMKGLHDLSIGTVLGSNTFNIMIGIGVPALFMNIPVEKLSLTFDAPVMIFVTVLVLLLLKRGMKLTRIDGLILVSTYIVYAITRLYISV